MSERKKNTTIISYFAMQRRKESTEIKEYEQEIDSSRPTCSTSVFSRLSLTLQKNA